MSVTVQSLQEYVSEKLLGGRDVGETEELLLSGLLDSLGVVALVQHLEKSLGRGIPPEDVTLEHFGSLTAIASYLNRG